MLIRKLVIGSALGATLLLTGCEAVVTNAGYYDYGYPGYYNSYPSVGYGYYGGSYYGRGYGYGHGHRGWGGHRGHGGHGMRHGGGGHHHR